MEFYRTDNNTNELISIFCRSYDALLNYEKNLKASTQEIITYRYYELPIISSRMFMKIYIFMDIVKKER